MRWQRAPAGRPQRASAERGLARQRRLLRVALLGVALAGAQVEARALEGDVRARDLPPVGHSLFDELVSERRGGEEQYRVPFPFTALVDALAAKGSDQRARVNQVLIPLGRSLQRAVAAPDYFRSPRIVVAFDDDSGYTQGTLLKDRLYLGYQEAADVVEVISYNEIAGRFEFQVVRGYRAGATPTVHYANRALCIACHQNEAPMFSRRLWSETNANPQVGALLARHQESFHGVPARGGVDIAQAIDDATDRANLYSTWHTLWRDGCDVPNAPARARRCRADALTLALARSFGIDIRRTPEHARLAAVLSDSWRRRWPQGLAIPNGDLPNRDPLMAIEWKAGTLPVSGPTSERLETFVQSLMRSNSIPSTLEPLRPRPPSERLSGEDPQLHARFADGLARFLSRADLKRIDRLLTDRRRRSPGKLEHVESRCTFRASKQHQRVSVACNDDEQHGVALRARLYLANGTLERGRVERMRIQQQPLIDLRLNPIATRTENGMQVLSMTPRRRHDGSSVYLEDARVVRAVTVRWPRNADRSEPIEGRIRTTLAGGLLPLRAALDAVLNDTTATTHPLDRGPFRRDLVIGALVRALEGNTKPTCCERSRAMPTPQLDEETLDQAQSPAAGIHAAFVTHCGQCHRSQHRSPPNFLSGDDAQIAERLAQCAERIHYRLQMWHRDDDGSSDKTPMPPASALAARDISAERWRAGAPLVSLSAHVRSLIESEAGASADRADALLNKDYASLRPCLAGSGGLVSADAASNDATTTSKP